MDEIRSDNHLIIAIVRAMYSLRAPIKSKTVAWEHISAGQQHENRKRGYAAVVAAFSESLGPSDDQYHGRIEKMARILYVQSGPARSEERPWESRSDFCQNYYREQAEDLLAEILTNYGSHMALGNGPVIRSASATSFESSDSNGIPSITPAQVSDGRGPKTAVYKGVSAAHELGTGKPSIPVESAAANRDASRSESPDIGIAPEAEPGKGFDISQLNRALFTVVLLLVIIWLIIGIF